MKRLLFLIVVLIPILSNAQAHLGSTEKEIKELHPDKTFKIEYTDDGVKYISTFMYYGTFVYYFDNETGLTNSCMQIIEEMTALNGQVEAYNKKYVIVSKSQWRAYLEGGAIMEITLEYNEEHKLYVFNYSF